MKRRIVSIAVALGLLAGLAVAGPALAGPPVDGQPDHGSVSNFLIISVGQTGASQVTVRVQANFCPACNPNPTGAPGCPAFTHTGWCWPNNADGRYVAVQVKDMAGTVLGMTKMVCDPTNWPMTVDHQADIVVNTSTPVPMCSWVVVEADIYCSWCGHYYPTPVVTQVDDEGPLVWVQEAVNPAGKKIPPAGSTTLPGPWGGINEDGFYQLFAEDNCSLYPYMVICYWDPGAVPPSGTVPLPPWVPGDGWWVPVTDKAGNVVVCFSGTVIKLTQAPGAPPSAKKMGSSANSKGKAVAVDWHITVPSPPTPYTPYGGAAVIVVAFDASGNSSWVVGYVPPPPK